MECWEWKKRKISLDTFYANKSHVSSAVIDTSEFAAISWKFHFPARIKWTDVSVCIEWKQSLKQLYISLENKVI